jgi:hypothetical protein
MTQELGSASAQALRRRTGHRKRMSCHRCGFRRSTQHLGECLRWCLEPEGCRGRSLSSWAMASKSAWVSVRKSSRLGRYWRSRPLVFSLLPRCQGDFGSQKNTCTPVSMVNRWRWAISWLRSQVRDLASCRGRVVIAAARERRPEFVGGVPDLTGLARSDRRAGRGGGCSRRRRWAGCWWRRPRQPGGQGAVPMWQRHLRLDAGAGGRGRRWCRRSGGSVGVGRAEPVWRRRRVGVVAGAEGVPRPGCCQWRQVAVSGHDRGRLGGRGELDLLRHRRS